MELFEGSCCSLNRHNDLNAKVKSFEELDSQSADYYIVNLKILGDEKL